MSQEIFKRRDAIKGYAERRNISLLTHFTRVDNLSSIIDHGLRSRVDLFDLGVNPIAPDEKRLDNYLDAISLSVSFPNYKMFFSCRKRMGGDWVVLIIHPSVLWEKDCAFCSQNAASSSIKSLDVDYLRGFYAFQDMFNESVGEWSRSSQKMELQYPTDPQAEVLVFESIEPELISGVAFLENMTIMRYLNFRRLLGGRRIYEGNEGSFYFSKRLSAVKG